MVVGAVWMERRRRRKRILSIIAVNDATANFIEA
jgi:hypothetical protein